MAGSEEARAAARGSLSAAALTAAARALALAFALVATRQLGSDDYAAYSVVFAGATLAIVLADLGTSITITREVSRAPDRAGPLLEAGVPLAVLLGLAGYLLGFGYYLAGGAADAGDWAVGGLSVIGASVLSSLTGALAGRGRLVERAAVQFGAQLIALGGGAVVLAAGGSHDGALVALAAGPVVACAVAAWRLRVGDVWRGRVRLSIVEAGALLRLAAPLAALGAMAVVVSRADLLVLALIDTSSETARYELAVRTVEGTAFLTLALSAPSVFLLTRRLAAGDRAGAQRAFEVVHRWVLLLGVGISAVLVPLAWPLAELAYGDDYRSVGTPLAILAASVWAGFLLAAQGSLLTSSEDPGKVVPLGITMLLVNAALVAALLPPYGAVGAAWATVATQAIGLVLYARTARSLTGVRTPWPDPRLAVAGAGAAATALALRDVGLAAALPAGVVVYTGLVVVLGAVGRDDLDDARSRLGRRT